MTEGGEGDFFGRLERQGRVELQTDAAGAGRGGCRPTHTAGARDADGGLGVLAIKLRQTEADREPLALLKTSLVGRTGPEGRLNTV